MYFTHFEKQESKSLLMYAETVGLRLLSFSDYLSHIRYIVELHWKILL